MSCGQEGSKTWLTAHLQKQWEQVLKKEAWVGQTERNACSACKMCKHYVGLTAVNIPQFLHLNECICFEAFCKNFVETMTNLI
jgi:hypothetical protein